LKPPLCCVILFSAMSGYQVKGGNISRDFLELLPIGAGYFVCEGGQYRALAVNGALRDLLGRSDAEIAASLSQSEPGFAQSEDAGRLSIIFYKAGVSGGIFRETARILTRGGEVRWMEISVNGEPLLDGTTVISVVFNDINVRMERQQKLDRTYSALLDVMNNSPGGIVVFDTINNRSLVPSFASQGMDKLLRGTRTQITALYGRDPYRSVHPDDREQVIRIIEDALRKLSPFQFSLRLRSVPGDYIWVSASGTIDTVENQRVLYMVFLDSSPDAESMHIQKQILNSFVRRQYDYICYIDGKHNSFRVLGTNDYTGPFLPARGDDFEGSIAALIESTVLPEEKENLLARLKIADIVQKLEGRDDIEYYCTLCMGGPRLRYKKIWLSWIDQETGSIALVLSDVTEEHKRSEESREALRAALRASEQASAAKTEFLSRMSHDIRTPLNAIIGFTDMSLEDPGISAPVRNYLGKAEASSKFLLSLINDILNMSRIESGRLALNESRFELWAFLDGISAIVSSQCASKHIKYSCRPVGTYHLSYRGDKLKIQQTILNIAGNAIKFTPEGGEISIEVREIQSGDPAIVRFTVADTGCGISENFRKHLFEPFAQERQSLDSEIKGTGLGLAICKSLVTMMGGGISVDSKPGRGSVFKIDLPLHPAGSEELKERESHVQPELTPEDKRDFGGRHTLLAEDNPLNREIAEHLLAAANLSVDSAEDGQKACALFEASPEGYYSAILMDIRMPLMDGLEATRKIRALERADSTVPIIAMSANAFDEDIRVAITNGMNAYTIKPIDVPQLYATLRQFIDT